MKMIINFTMVMTLATALALTGACANIADDRTRTQTEGTLVGTGIGAAIGAGIGAALGGRRGALAGAAIGAGVGGMAGLAYGTSVANKKREYASEEEWLAACLAEAKTTNEQAAAYNNRLKNTLAGYNKSVSDKNLAQNIKKDLKESGQVLAHLDHTISSQEKAIASTASNAQTKQIQTQVNELKKQKQLLEQNNRELAAISNRIAM
jgi:gas vesicle protein